MKYGRTGSNQYEPRMTIVDRGGEFLVAGFAQDWDMRASMGSCDINFLTGGGGGARLAKPAIGNSPIKLVDWPRTICQRPANEFPDVGNTKPKLAEPTWLVRQ